LDIVRKFIGEDRVSSSGRSTFLVDDRTLTAYLGLRGKTLEEILGGLEEIFSAA
jgi:hypothetical protein